MASGIAMYVYVCALGLLCLNQPPTLPTHYIERPKLLKEITEKLLSTEIDNTIHITVVITGMAGFGKSTLAKALCHQELIKKHFRNGFLVIELGPKPRRKCLMLCEIYHTLTGNRWTNPTASVQGSISEDEMIACLIEELNRLCKSNPHLLVIIDDVWEVEDASDYAEILSHCKIVLTTRRKDIASSIDCKHKIHIDSMELFEAVQLLTFKIEELKTISSEIVDQLNELAMNLHNWPLLLNLVRGQLYKCCKSMPNSPLSVIKHVTKKLFDNGLTAFDPKRPNRRNAANASIKASLDLLRESTANRLNRLIVSSYFSSKVPKRMLVYVWQLNNEQVTEACDELWSVGLISHTMLPFNTAGMEIHLVITQYVFDNITSSSFFQASLNMFSDYNIHQQYHRELLGEMAAKGLDDTQLGLWVIDLLDSINIPSLLHKAPMMLQTTITAVQSSMKDEFSELGIPDIEKQTFLRVREKCKMLLLYLNEGKRDQAVVYVTEANENYYRYFTELTRIMSSSAMIHPSLREKWNLLIGSISSFLPQFAKAYVDTRLDLYTVLILSKTPSVDKVVNILKTYNDQVNKATLPVFRGISALMQTTFTVFPNYQNNAPTTVQVGADILSSFQLADSNLRLFDRFNLASSYVSQNQDNLSNASCIII